MAKNLSEHALESSRAKRLVPVNVAALLRMLQSSAHPSHPVSITLDVDEGLHVAAEPESLLREIGGLLHESIASSPSGAHIVLHCSSEPGGVVVEIERTTPAPNEKEEHTLALTLTLPGLSAAHAPRTWTSSSTTAMRSTSA